MLTIDHAPGTGGFRLIWLCEELALRYALEQALAGKQYLLGDPFTAADVSKEGGR